MSRRAWLFHRLPQPTTKARKKSLALEEKEKEETARKVAEAKEKNARKVAEEQLHSCNASPEHVRGE